jgi:hypothetical protein
MLPRFAARALPACLLALLATASRAEEVHKQLTGKVSSVFSLSPSITDALAAHGVTSQASVVVDYTLESTTPATVLGDVSVYFSAITDMTITIGTYVVQAEGSINSVTVDQGRIDSYSLTASGPDTDGILTQDPSFPSMTLIFNDMDGSTLSDESLLQDPLSFAHSFCTINSAILGTTIYFAIDVEGSGPGGPIVDTHLTGKVNVITEQRPGTAAALAALGVEMGADVQIDISVDSGTVGNDDFAPFKTYDSGLVECKVTIGEWEAHLENAVLVPLNFVQVGDNVKPTGQPKSDSYVTTCSAIDTDLVLTGPTSGLASTMFILFVDPKAKALKNEDVAQDLKKFKIAQGSVGGAGGSVGFVIDLGGGGPGSAGSELARKGQMLAAASFGKAVLKAHAKFAAAPPEKDPFGDKVAALVDKAQDDFLVQFSKAVTKALKKGGTAPLPEGMKQVAADSVLGGCDALVEALLAGALPDDPQDRALRGKLMKAASAQLGADLVAHAKDVVNPKPDKLADKLAKSRDKLLAAVGKALDKAEKQGVAYAGPDAEAIAAAVTTIVDAYVELTLGAG